MSVQQNLLSKTWASAKSMKLAIGLVVLITIAVTADILLLTQRWNPAGAAQTGEVYRYWWFQLMVVLLLVNLSACTIDNAVKRIKARSRNIGLWGSTVFHTGLIVILIGTIVSGNFRMFSTIKLIQGESKQIPYVALTTEDTILKGDQEPFQLTLRDQQVDLAGNGKIKDNYSTIELSNGNKTASYRLADRQEVLYRGIYMFPSLYGYAVQLTVTPNTAQAPHELIIPMDTMEYAEGIKAYLHQGYRNSQLPFAISFKFYPDLKERGPSGGYINQSNSLGQPGLDINIAGTGGPAVEKLVLLGESIEAQGYQIKFSGVKPWTQLTSVYDPGASIVFGGILVAIIGFTVFSLFDTRKGI
jgi:cytochrome c biogenesis protein ResB